jgi:hypothetical protein
LWFVQDAEKDGKNDSRACSSLRVLGAPADPELRRAARAGRREIAWRDQKAGSSSTAADTDFRAGVLGGGSAYPAYPDSCLIYAMA